MIIDEIKPYGKNTKKHPDKQIEQIANSIKEFGFNQPLVIDKKGVIIVGHGRYFAALKLGLKEVPAIKVDLPEKKAKAYRLADNKLNESDWEMELVIEELKGLDNELIELTGFDKDLLIEPDEQDDIIPENSPPRATQGQIWALGRHRVMCGDSTKKEDVERLMDGKKADLILTDMPYGIDKNGIENDNLKAEDFDKFNDDYISVLPAKKDCGFICYHSTRTFNPTINSALRNGWKFEKMLFFHRPDKFPVHTWNGWMMTSQAILLFTRGKTEYYKISPAQQDVYRITSADLTEVKVKHPTVKPVSNICDLMKHFIAVLIFDGFLGSGSTLIACEKTNRICYGMEIDPKYCDVIIQKIKPNY